MGELQHEAFQFTFNGFLKVAFQGSRVTSDAGLILVRELDERLGLGTLISEHLNDSRQGLNVRRQINPDQWVCFVRETSCRFTVLRDVHRFSRLRCASVLRLTCSRRARIAGRRPA